MKRLVTMAAALAFIGGCASIVAGTELADLSQFCQDLVEEPPRADPEFDNLLWTVCMEDNDAACSDPLQGTPRCSFRSGSGSASIDSPFGSS